MILGQAPPRAGFGTGHNHVCISNTMSFLTTTDWLLRTDMLPFVASIPSGSSGSGTPVRCRAKRTLRHGRYQVRMSGSSGRRTDMMPSCQGIAQNQRGLQPGMSERFMAGMPPAPRIGRRASQARYPTHLASRPYRRLHRPA